MPSPTPPSVGPPNPEQTIRPSTGTTQSRQHESISPLDWVTGADSITATLVAAVLIGAGIRNWFRRTIGRRLVFTDALNSLATGTTPEYARALFGAPAYGHLDSTGAGTWTWVTHFGYLGATYRDHSLIAWAFTLTSTRLSFHLGHQSLGTMDGILGDATAQELVGEPSGQTFWVGARRYGYAETHFFGNPGGYQAYALAFNDAGMGDFPIPERVDQVGEYATGDLKIPPEPGRTVKEPPDLYEVLASLRDGRPNTFGVLGMGATDRDEWYQLIVPADLDVVRLMRRPEPRRRMLRRRVRAKLNRRQLAYIAALAVVAVAVYIAR